MYRWIGEITMRDHAKLKAFELAKVFGALVRFFTDLTDFSLNNLSSLTI